MAVKSMLRVRMSAKDAHYGGNLVDGAHMLHLFGDVATEPMTWSNSKPQYTLATISKLMAKSPMSATPAAK